MKSKASKMLAIAGMMAMIGGMGTVERGMEIASTPSMPMRSKPRRHYYTRTYGAGNNQRKRRKYARQTPSARKWK